MSPLSDRAPRNNGNARRLSEYYETKATLEFSNKLWLLRGPRAWHADTEDVGTWENQEGYTRMQNNKIKKDNFKTSLMPSLVVRLIRSSEEVE
jgi:hypothetical protein